jgi:hypothetical protein
MDAGSLWNKKRSTHTYSTIRSAGNDNPSLTLKEKYDPKSEGWQEQQSRRIVGFWSDDGAWRGIPFFQAAATHYILNSGAF